MSDVTDPGIAIPTPATPRRGAGTTIEFVHVARRGWHARRLSSQDWRRVTVAHLGENATDAELLYAADRMFGYVETRGARIVRLPAVERLPRPGDAP